MANFLEHMRQRLEVNGYKFERKFADLDLIMRSPDDKLIWICYLEVGIEPEQIRRMFDFSGHVLIVVNEKLIPDEIVSREQTPMWLRAIHGLWMGRIYVWNDRHLFGLHFDYDTGDVSESGIIQPDELLLIETGTWLRGWPGTYKLARFYDKQWWNEDYSKPPYNYRQPGSQHSNARTEYEQARDHYWKQQKAREQAQEKDRNQGWNEYVYSQQNAHPPKDFMREFARAGSPSAVKALYRELAKKYHPDLNPGVDTTVEMQAVNAAYERYK